MTETTDTPLRFVPSRKKVYSGTGIDGTDTLDRLVGLGDGAWLIVHHDVVVTSGVTTAPSNGWTFKEEMTEEGFTRFLLNIADLAKRKADEAATLASTLEHQRRAREALAADLHAYADEHDLGEDFDDVTSEHGLGRREHEYAVTVRVTFESTLHLSAPDKARALSRGYADLALSEWEQRLNDGQITDARVIERVAIEAEQG